MTTSGAMIAISMIPTRREAILIHLSSGPGILGCTATQVHTNVVTRQLQLIFQIILPVAFAQMIVQHLDGSESNVQKRLLQYDDLGDSIIEMGNA